jgi:hypothetical protein
MADILTIDLRNHVPRGGDIEFLRAETSAKHRTPFVLVRYALKGQEQTHGLRLDLDKRAFLDHFEDPARESMVVRAAGQIAELVGLSLSRGANGQGTPLPSTEGSPTP